MKSQAEAAGRLPLNKLGKKGSEDAGNHLRKTKKIKAADGFCICYQSEGYALSPADVFDKNKGALSGAGGKYLFLSAGQAGDFCGESFCIPRYADYAAGDGAAQLHIRRASEAAVFGLAVRCIEWNGMG